MSIVIGLTGQIGSGKSLAAALLREMGAAIIDADALSRQVVERDQPAYNEIIAAFGEEYLLPGGGLNRQALAALIFADKQARRRLNAITHPRIQAEAERLIAAYRAAGRAMIVLEAALLIGNEDFCTLVDEIWLVSAPPELIYQRLAARDGLSEAEADARLQAQLPLKTQAALASRVIVNNGGAAALREQLAALYRQLAGAP